MTDPGGTEVTRRDEAVEARPVSSYADARSGRVLSAEWWLVMADDLSTTWRPVRCDAETGELVDRPAWLPLPGSQYDFLTCPVFEALYAGNRGPGKTTTLLLDFARDVGAGHGKAWRGILFRRQFGDLDDVVAKIDELFPRIFGSSFRFLRSKSEYMAVWDTGESLLLRHLNDETDYDEYHGHEYPWIGFEELTQWENDRAFRLMFSCCRSATPGVRPRVRASTNPSGVGHSWVRRRYRLPEMYGRVVREDEALPRVAIEARMVENFLLLHSQPQYRTLVAQAASSSAQREAWLDGSWRVASGGLFDDVWDPAHHVVPDLRARDVPRSWRIHRAYDHGQSSPFSVGWWAESSGEPAVVDGVRVGEVRGDLVRLDEWYGTAGGDDEGLRMPSWRIGRGIADREADAGWAHRVRPGPADDQIFTRESDRDNRSPADDMSDEGVTFERADKSPGSRKRGWEAIRGRLVGALPGPDGTRDRPGLLVCRRCRHWLDLVPEAPRSRDDPDELASGYEDHLLDETRYRVTWEPPVVVGGSF